jgi:CFEM domain
MYEMVYRYVLCLPLHSKQMCLQNMLALAPALGCSAADATCLCENPNFLYGVRDCSIEACGASEQQIAEAFAVSYCSCTSDSPGLRLSN